MELNDCNLLELFNTIQQSAYEFSATSMVYKSRVTNCNKKLKAKNQNLKKELEQAKKQSTNTMILELEENVTLSESKGSHLERELSSVKGELVNSRKDLDTQRFAFKYHLEAKTSCL